MKRTLGIITMMALATGIASNVMAKTEKKDQPKARFVKEALEALGGTHFPEKIKIKRISSIEIGETYYHVYEGELEKTGYHIIVFDNQRNYLGYYKSDFPPTNYEIEGCIVIDSGNVDEDTGDQLYFPIPINPKKGLPKKVQIGGMPTSFVQAPKSAATTKGAAGDGEITPEYREWVILHKGKKIPVRAIYIKQSSGKVYLKAEASGATKPFLISSLSRDDQAYVKQFK